jgi:SAM-dependent methyltransferase
VANVIEMVSPKETMHNMHLGGDLAGYLRTGEWIVGRIHRILELAEKEGVSRILDLPCGYGRVARWLRADFPQARLVVCDIDRDAVDFCAETFDGKPVYSAERPKEIELPGRFDLIWCGSLVTHLDRLGWIGFMQFFESALKPGGVLIFTTLGRFAAETFHRDGGDRQGLSDERSAALFRAYDEHGFGFCDYADEEGYGLSLASPPWVCRLLEEHAPCLDLLAYTAGGWGLRWGAPNVPGNGLNSQDFVACRRVRDEP